MEGNFIRIVEGDTVHDYDHLAYQISGLSTKIDGKGNLIILHKPFQFSGCLVEITGDDNVIEIYETSLSINQTHFCMAPRANNRSIIIGKNTYIGQAKLMCFGQDNKLHIGEGCLLSSGIHIRTGDAHSIIDCNTGRLLNKNGDVIIGDHVWFGVDSYVGKRVHICSNVIIAAKAVVVKSIDEQYTSWGGVPARLLKPDVRWDITSDDVYKETIIEKRFEERKPDVKKVVFIDDIFRREIIGARRCIHKTLFAQFKRAFDLEITAPRFSVGEGNEFIRFRMKFSGLEWEDCYWELPEEAEKEYVRLLDTEGTIYMTYEAPEWLYRVFEKYNIKFIDLRLSYLRFLPDMPIMFSTNIPSMIPRLKEYEIREEDILMEANLMKASYNFRHFSDWKNCGRYKDSLIIIGQTERDTSLMVPGKCSAVKFQDFEDKISLLLGYYENVFYKKHPFASPEQVKADISFFSSLLHRQVAQCDENFYNLAAQDFRIDFMGLSSGALKEAHYFGKSTFPLIDYPFDRREDTHCVRYLNVQAFHFFSPKFWQECLNEELPVNNPCACHREVHPNMMRDHHNASWGYNAFYYENRMSIVESIVANGENVRRFVCGDIEKNMRQQVATMQEAVTKQIRGDTDNALKQRVAAMQDAVTKQIRGDTDNTLKQRVTAMQDAVTKQVRGDMNALSKRQVDMVREVLMLPAYRRKLKRIRLKILFACGARRQRYVRRKQELKQKIKAVEKFFRGN